VYSYHFSDKYKKSRALREECPALIANVRLQTLGDLLEQVNGAAGIAPFVVVPAHELEEFLVQLDAAAGVEDARQLAVDEVAADDFVAGVTKNAFEIGLAGFFHGRANLGVAGFLRGLEGQVNDADSRRRNAEGHTGEFAFDFRNREADGFRGTGGGWDNVLRGGTATFPIFLRWAVHGFLRGGVAMDGGHQTFFNAESFLQQDVNHRREAVRGAARIGDDVVLGGIVLLVVDAHDDGDVFVLAGGADDDFLGAGVNVTFGLRRVGKKTGAFDDDVNTERLPRQCGWTFFDSEAFDFVAVDDEDIILGDSRRGFLARHGAGEAALRRVILNQVREVVRWDEIVDGDDFDFFTEQTLIADCAEH